MNVYDKTLNRLRNLQAMRRQVAATDQALQELTPEERLVAQLLLVSPQKGNVQRLCQLLEVEQSTVYRRREQVLKKLNNLIFPGESPVRNFVDS